MASVLHAISQALLIPVITLLIAFIGYALFCIGSIIVEAINERRNFKVEMPKFLAALMAASDAEIPGIIKNSGLLNRQKAALLTVYDYRTLPGDALVALIRRLVGEEESHYTHITDRNNTASKLAPMAGLMGTLIPLGPGVAALGTGDTETLSNSLLIAFDTTVAGLIVAVICMAIGKIRSNWYNDYMLALDSAMATLHEKIEAMRESGEITVKEPSNYAFMFQEGLKKADASKGKANKQAAPGAQQQTQPGAQAPAGQMTAAQAAAARAAAGAPAAAPGMPAPQQPGAPQAGRAATPQQVQAQPAVQGVATAARPGAVAPSQTGAIAAGQTGAIPTQAPQQAQPQAQRPAVQASAAATAAASALVGSAQQAGARTQASASPAAQAAQAQAQLNQQAAQAQARAAQAAQAARQATQGR